MTLAVLQGTSLGSDLLNSAADLVTIGGTLVLLLMLVAFGGFVYKSLQGDGIEWPDDVDDEETSSDEGVQRSQADDEWKYH